MNRVRFILKSGYDFVIFCENAKVTFLDNELTGYTLTGVKGYTPLYLRISEIDAVIDEGPVKEEAEDDA